jgi:tRNA pseudouridine13 synthase
MKLKCQPEDFQVAELTAFTADGGQYALYRLTKEALGTPEAIELVSRHWRLTRQRISFGGLKDKHARTQQFVTVYRGPPRHLPLGRVHVEYLGQASRPFTPEDIRGNHFHIVLRDLSAEDVEVARQALDGVQRDGVPNYFDDQRFGSLGESGEFIARPWCAGDYERALWLALADPHADDTAAQREQKRILREHWGDWSRCQAALTESPRRSVVSHLAAQPGDFRGALARIGVDLRGLYLAAFQSFLWNRMLAALLHQECAAADLVDVGLRIGPVPFFLSLTPQQREQLGQVALPLPSARLHLEDGPILRLIQDTLTPLGLELRQLRVKYPRDSFFAKGTRPPIVQPAELGHSTGADELYAGRRQLTLDFELPRGSYATMLVKRLTLAP